MPASLIALHRGQDNVNGKARHPRIGNVVSQPALGPERQSYKSSPHLYAACSDLEALPSGKLTVGFMVPPASHTVMTAFLPFSAAWADQGKQGFFRGEGLWRNRGASTCSLASPHANPLGHPLTSFSSWTNSGLGSMGLTPLAAYAINLNALVNTWPWLKSMAWGRRECFENSGFPGQQLACTWMMDDGRGSTHSVHRDRDRTSDMSLIVGGTGSHIDDDGLSR